MPEEIHRPEQSEEAHQEPQQGGAGAGPRPQVESEGEEGRAEPAGGQPGQLDGGAGDDELLLSHREHQPHVRGWPRQLRHWTLDQEAGGREIQPASVLQQSSLPRVYPVTIVVTNYILAFLVTNTLTI